MRVNIRMTVEAESVHSALGTAFSMIEESGSKDAVIEVWVEEA